MPYEWVRAWAELAEGCQDMTDKKVLHRDLQLDNILLFLEPYDEKDNEIAGKAHHPDQSKFKKVIKLADFGVGCVEAEKENVTRGSLRHYSPEGHIHKKEYISASDVYSLAYLIHEMMHGKRVFGNQIPMEELMKKVAARLAKDQLLKFLASRK
eukprot:CAMPEP_0114602416 /NCGR_PEP_ID=MMETSP0125-20121206/24988_1 /TAXON_ID=485358 ORGANISM="Aristerostoma sp., Strain ATCC 50986" /NCGR_SAMPLE_ID=MMETSP0125 /ASSEMBLY_ACC=CAM_ASM_000245 /LENGTH=153 /DNA_ID=CAMNT_0001812529 /DNA_START=1288 /DNA_END=1749 /DNA_ORIENTATION=+